MVSFMLVTSIQVVTHVIKPILAVKYAPGVATLLKTDMHYLCCYFCQFCQSELRVKRSLKSILNAVPDSSTWVVSLFWPGK